MLFNSHNSDNIEIRPRFKLITTLNDEVVIKKIVDGLPKQSMVEGSAKGNHIFLSINNKDKHYWSPVMEVVVEKYIANKDKTSVRCLIGPRHNVWMMLMFFYTAIGVSALFGGMYGLVIWNLGKESIFIWVFPVAALLLGTIYLTSKYGQKKARDQMLYIVSFLYHAIDDNEIERL